MASGTTPKHAGVLAAYGSAAARPRSVDALARARDEVAAKLGEQGVIDAACVASLFAGISRIVDATGLPDPNPKELEMMGFALKRGLPCLVVGIILLGMLVLRQ